MAGASEPVAMFTKRQRIAELARQSPEMGFTSLAYFIDIDWLYEAYRRTRKDGAVGVDGQSGADYAEDLESNLRSPLERAKSGTYQAPPVRRAHIPKAGSATETRPPGIPTFEDKRFEKYGLTIHPEKTRLVPFERPPDRPQRSGTPVGTPAGTFDLLGFTHYWGRSRRGRRAVKRKTSRSRFRRGLKALSEWCRLNRHRDLEDQHRTLNQRLTGHFAYHGITGNSPALNRLRTAATWLWKRWLSRRRRGGRMTWDRLNRYLKRHPLPPAIAIHSVCRPVALA